LGFLLATHGLHRLGIFGSIFILELFRSFPAAKKDQPQYDARDHKYQNTDDGKNCDIHKKSPPLENETDMEKPLIHFQP
jgi:hypothetical protein